MPTFNKLYPELAESIIYILEFEGAKGYTDNIALIDNYYVRLDTNETIHEFPDSLGLDKLGLTPTSKEYIDEHYNALCSDKLHIREINGNKLSRCDEPDFTTSPYMYNLIEWCPVAHDMWGNVICATIVQNKPLLMLFSTDRGIMGLMTIELEQFIKEYTQWDEWFKSALDQTSTSWNAPIKKMFESRNFNIHFD